MPYAPPKPCLKPGCPNFVDGHGAYCRVHSNRRLKKSNPIYHTTKHRKWRMMVLGRCPICAHCQERPASHADHIIPLTKGGGWELENGQGLCPACHNRKTLEENK